jgi:hypothetical protein
MAFYAICVSAGLGFAFFNWWPGEDIYWQMGGVFIVSVALILGVFRRKLSTQLFWRMGGGVCLLWGGALFLNFGDVLGSGSSLALISLSLVAGGIWCLFCGRSALSHPVLLVALASLFIGGCVGWGDKVFGWARTGVIGVYDPVAPGKGIFFVTDPCFLALGGDGVIHVLSAGHGGVFPNAPSPNQVGKHVGPYKIIGVVEKGAEIHMVSGEDGDVAILDFSLVSPSPAQGRFAVVRPPI